MASFGHVGLTVRNLEASLRFYRDVAGMTVESDFALENGGFAKLTSNPAAAIKVVHLRAGSFQLQLVEYTAGGGTALTVHHNNIGSPHLSFNVDDVEAKYREVKGLPYRKDHLGYRRSRSRRCAVSILRIPTACRWSSCRWRANQ